jgi:hypothetical protein
MQKKKKTHTHTYTHTHFLFHYLLTHYKFCIFLQTVQTQISKKYGSNANQNEEYDKCSLLTPKRDERKRPGFKQIKA